jgi:plasmid stabilization system protein ParE
MTFTVVWKPSAEAMLAHLWNTAADRNEVQRAADAIDAQLRRNPLTVGESRGDSLRLLIIHPLGVHYQVSEDDRLVLVLKVWHI